MCKALSAMKANVYLIGNLSQQCPHKKGGWDKTSSGSHHLHMQIHHDSHEGVFRESVKIATWQIQLIPHKLDVIFYET